MTFDPWQQSKIQNGLNKLQAVSLPENNIDSLDELKRLAGVNEQASMGANMSKTSSNLGQIQRERNIRPGDPEWFKLWFAKPELTGEDPYDKY